MNGNPIANATVAFASPASGASAVLAGSPATTNGSGLATVTATANATAGSYAVTASVAGVSAPASFSLTNNPGTPATIAVSGASQSAAIGTAFASPLVALVSDSGGSPLNPQCDSDVRSPCAPVGGAHRRGGSRQRYGDGELIRR